MSRFKVGDIVGKVGDYTAYIITNTYEDFCNAKSVAEISKHYPSFNRNYIKKNIIVDELSPNWLKIENVENPKFKIDEKIFFLIDNKWSNDHDKVFAGTVMAYMAETKNYTPSSSDGVSYTYIVKEAETGKSQVVKERYLFRNINTNSVWNSLLENSK